MTLPTHVAMTPMTVIALQISLQVHHLHLILHPYCVSIKPERVVRSVYIDAYSGLNFGSMCLANDISKYIHRIAGKFGEG